MYSWLICANKSTQHLKKRTRYLTVRSMIQICLLVDHCTEPNHYVWDIYYLLLMLSLLLYVTTAQSQVVALLSSQTGFQSFFKRSYFTWLPVRAKQKYRVGLGDNPKCRPWTPRRLVPKWTILRPWLENCSQEDPRS